MCALVVKIFISKVIYSWADYSKKIQRWSNSCAGLKKDRGDLIRVLIIQKKSRGDLFVGWLFLEIFHTRCGLFVRSDY